MAQLTENNRTIFESLQEFRRMDAEMENRLMLLEERRQSDTALRTRIELVRAIIDARNMRVDTSELERLLAASATPDQPPSDGGSA